MRASRSSLLVWFALLGAPAAWTAQFLVGFWLTEVGCSAGGDHGLAVDGWTLVATAVAAGVAVLAELAAIRIFRETREARGAGGAEEPPPKGRVHFFASVGVAIAPLFFFIIVMSGVGVLVLPNCAQAQPRGGISHPANQRSLSPRQLGEQLYAGNCASCHGIDGRGLRSPRPGAGDVFGQGPPLRGVGALAADFYLRTGYMPLGDPSDQPTRRDVEFSEREIRGLVDYVASLARGPAIPNPQPGAGNLAEGQQLFTEHCAGCHQVVAQGGFVTGARVPPLKDANARQIAEAVRVGPYLMPRFPKSQISDGELDSIVAYVLSTKDPPDRGGWGIGNIGPVPEGMVTWLIAALALVLMCLVIGERLRS